MSKRILLIRHAKSDWTNPKQHDHDRELNKRGHLAAPEMAARLKKRHIVPQKLVSSTAVRAHTTANYFAETLGFRQDEIVLNSKIYEASTRTLLAEINKFKFEEDFIAMFGHNPGITMLANELCNGYIENVPTCGMILMEFPFEEWSMISKGTGEILFFDYPKAGED